MKLSEAIKLGSMWNQQAFDCLIDGHGNTCAQGAALVAHGLTQNEIAELRPNPDVWRKRVPELLEQIWVTTTHPVTGERMTVATVIISLNNQHRWSRIRIADWVETVEAEHPQPAEQFAATTGE